MKPVLIAAAFFETITITFIGLSVPTLHDQSRFVGLHMLFVCFIYTRPPVSTVGFFISAILAFCLRALMIDMFWFANMVSGNKAYTVI